MLKSLSDSLRSLWHPRADEAVQRTSRKRKRPSNEGDQDDSESEVEVISVKIPKKEHPDSGTGFLALLKVPMSRMSEWVRKKTVRQDHFFVRPVPTHSHWHRKGSAEGVEQEATRYSCGEPDARNGALAHDPLQAGDRLSRPPVHSKSRAHENGVNGEGERKEGNGGALNSSVTSSRRSSCSSSRPGVEKRSTLDKCFHLKERACYLKLLQQFTTVDLGYHGNRNKADHRQGALVRETYSRRKPGLNLPVPSAPPSSSSSSSSSTTTSAPTFTSRSDLHHPAPSFPVTPSRFLLLPRGHPSSSLSASSSGPERRFAVPGRPGRALQVGSGQRIAGRRTQRKSLASGGFGDSPPITTPSPTSDADESVQIIPDPGAKERLKVTSHSAAGQGRLAASSSAGQQSAEMSDVSQRLKGTAACDTERQPVVDGLARSPVQQSAPCLNFKSSEYLDEEWLSKLSKKYETSENERQRLIEEAEVKKKLLEERREARLANLGKKLEKQLRLFEEEPEVIEELPLPEVPQVKPLPELTEAMLREVGAALADGPPGQVLAEGFRLQLTRADIATLRGLNWLNDEVINFYMNMLMERGEQDGHSKTYAFNTFFYPKLLQGGHSAVKRWTRKVDVFAHRYLIVPVHLGVHWCLCMVFVKDKKICYYDSMGGQNSQCLNAVRQYLADESQQKRSIALDLSEWTAEIVKEIPQQMNGSDCGMFTCMYAETLTRGENITFTQKDMPYFRKRMVYEILKKKLL
ncbi:uncharacterized protein LOC143293902 isoform X2 [Babylonia areolata]|uniref:uncharacterized protein LOC143293902 isoform X2 n=1 Tax=Babylonia areolata TaxID=304850 RepID=UPI003FD14C26